ncbi:EF-hand domain-containing protein [Chloropicon primus]|uniref:EF-hand domain-containing protein n=1 Tax=Chloropicon primus TaxID=1764295 RepID=A0A5B8MLL0_9CHLO|nr:hypothetical protein A3770_05p37190 [Chloropicon primus]UPR00415.1 EF-hand domain-containing protein [Chloropicon primus]|eukprot:QDZ21201.1 hypothetical protein A3770_05p37190 [Chloropicon primus]
MNRGSVSFRANNSVGSRSSRPSSSSRTSVLFKPGQVIMTGRGLRFPRAVSVPWFGRRKRRGVVRGGAASTGPAGAGISPQRDLLKGASAEDLRRYEALFHKYSLKSCGVLTLDEFQELMHCEGNADASGSVNWDEAFLREFRGMGPLERLRKVVSVIYDRFVLGKARRGSGQFLLLSALGMFAGVVALCSVCDFMMGWGFFSGFHKLGAPFILGSFGTLSILVFGQPDSANIRVWNGLVGHVTGAACGYLAMRAFGYTTMAKAAAMTATLVCMLWTGAVHPPGGAIALLMVHDTKLQVLGRWYILYPALFGAVVLYLAGFVTNRVKERFGAT